jgi:hypothetical protein
MKAQTKLMDQEGKKIDDMGRPRFQGRHTVAQSK